MIYSQRVPGLCYAIFLLSISRAKVTTGSLGRIFSLWHTGQSNYSVLKLNECCCSLSDSSFFWQFVSN